MCVPEMPTSRGAGVRVESQVFGVESESSRESLGVESESSRESLTSSPSRVASLSKKNPPVLII